MNINLTKVERKFLVLLIQKTMPKIKYDSKANANRESITEVQKRVNIIDKLNGAV